MSQLQHAVSHSLLHPVETSFVYMYLGLTKYAVFVLVNIANQCSIKTVQNFYHAYRCNRYWFDKNKRKQTQQLNFEALIFFVSYLFDKPTSIGW